MNAEQNRSRVLVVEDDPDVRESLLEVLADEGVSASGAANGALALEYLRAASEPPGLILLDLMMPVMDGFEFREVQRQHPEWRRIPIVVLTADASASAKAARIGAADSLSKPVDLDRLYECIRKYLALGG